jgi:hypothetical protein
LFETFSGVWSGLLPEKSQAMIAGPKQRATPIGIANKLQNTSLFNIKVGLFNSRQRKVKFAVKYLRTLNHGRQFNYCASPAGCSAAAAAASCEAASSEA